MQRILISIALVFVCVSCKKELYEDLRIIIRNRTDADHIAITLYPIKTSETNSTEYPECENCLYHTRSTEYTLFPYDEADRVYGNLTGTIYYSTDLTVKPYELSAMAFDSIHIDLFKFDEEKWEYVSKASIKFTQKTVTGYTENIFTENSTWNYEMDEGVFFDKIGISKKPYKYHCYIFSILDDNRL